MNTETENEKDPEKGDARLLLRRAEPLDPEPSAPKESAEFRETAERGYGWGV
jgi:hypothetical protein